MFTPNRLANRPLGHLIVKELLRSRHAAIGTEFTLDGGQDYDLRDGWKISSQELCCECTGLLRGHTECALPGREMDTSIGELDRRFRSRFVNDRYDTGI